MLPPAGLPHSDIQGSPEACSSPWLFAACHVLPRLPAPRHPPCALTTLGQFPLFPQGPAHLAHRLTALVSSPTRIVNQLCGARGAEHDKLATRRGIVNGSTMPFRARACFRFRHGN